MKDNVSFACLDDLFLEASIPFFMIFLMLYGQLGKQVKQTKLLLKEQIIVDTLLRGTCVSRQIY